MGNYAYGYADGNAPLTTVWYRIKANAVVGAAQYSDQANVKAVEFNTKNGISIYPNLITDGSINLYFNNKLAGRYSITIVDNLGRVVKTTNADVQNNNTVKKVTIPEESAGMYRVTVTDALGNKITMSIVNQ